MKVQDFKPQFDDGVYEWLPAAPDKPSVQIHPDYCLSRGSAGLLFQLLQQEGLAPLALAWRPPIIQASGSHFLFNRDVPWFSFAKPEGSQENPSEQVIWRNAGILASYWNMPGVVGPAAILEAVKQDVMMPVGV